MKADGLARKVPRRWAQVSRLVGPMVRHAKSLQKSEGGSDVRPGDARGPTAARGRASPCANTEGATVTPGPPSRSQPPSATRRGQRGPRIRVPR